MQISVALRSTMLRRTARAFLVLLLGCGASAIPGHIATAAARGAAFPANWRNHATAASLPAGTGCTATSPPILAGTQALEPSVDTDSLGQAEAFQVTGAACGVVSSLNLYLDASSTAGTIVVGLYTDNAGNPGSLLTQGNTTTPLAGAWNSIAVPPVSVAAGTVYWIAILGTTSGVIAFLDAPSGCTSQTSASTTLTSLPQDWTTGTSWPSCPLSAYAATSATAISTYSISGAISPPSAAAGSIVTLSGAASASTTPDASGTYSFTGLSGGNYTVTPSSQSAHFNPASEPVTVTDSSVSAVNFRAADTANTIFYDDFSGPSLSPAWTIIQRHGEYSQGETECNTPGAVSVQNGGVTITTSAIAAYCGDYPVLAGIYPAYPGTAASSWPYTTGAIQWTSFNFTFGTITFRAKFPPSNTNTWPAIWLLGANCQASNMATGNTGYNGDAGVGNCPNFLANYEEEDLVECAVNEAGPGRWCHFAYWSGASFGICNINLDANWHVFQFVWSPTSITEYLDGTQVCQITAAAALAIPQQPMFLIIQTQTGGIGGTPDNANLPSTLQVDYVKVTQP
jgi:Glycosyl hydrolases family 16